MSKLDDNFEEIREKYVKENKSLMSLAEEYHCNRQTVRKLLADHGIKIRNAKKQNSKQVPQEIQDQVIYNYNVLRMGLIPSGKPFNLSQQAVKTILQKNGVYIRSYVESKDNLRKYQINDDYFKTQSHNMAYILGFLAADGNVSKKENGISINLRSHDKEILEKINKEIGNTRPVKTYMRTDKKGEMAKLAFWSSTIKKDLAHYGIVPNKTFIIQPPELLLPEYRISYIRGYFDGDGTIAKTGYSYQFGISGASKAIIEWIRDILSTQYNITTTMRIEKEKLSEGRDWYILSYYGERVKKIYDILYVENSLFLERKFKRFQNFMNDYSTRLNYL